jgi:putative acetyltransferase
MQRAIEWAKTVGQLRRIELFVYVTNAPAIRLYERHGFVVEGKRRNAIRVGNDFVADLIMAYHVSS